jgi:hypothetical protein
MRNLNGFEIAGRTLRVDNGEILNDFVFNSAYTVLHTGIELSLLRRLFPDSVADPG